MSSYSVDMFYDDMLMMYQAVNVEPFGKVVLPIQMKEFGKLVEGVFEQKFISYKDVIPVKVTSDTGSVGVSFSGGKDSAGLAVHLRNKGYNVTLFHIKNMNRAYPDEYTMSMKFAEQYKFGIHVIPAVPVRKGAYIENIVKNNLLIAQVLKFGQVFRVPNVALGCASLNDQMLADYGFSDSNQNLASFGRGVEALFGNKVLVEEVESEGMSYKILVDAGVDFQYIVSCMMPVRYRKNLAMKNLEKDILIRHGGCGQCYKCAMDYYYLESYGLLKFDKATYKHYAEVLVKQWDRSFVKKPKNLREYFLHFLSDKYVDMVVVFEKLRDSGVDLDKEI